MNTLRVKLGERSYDIFAGLGLLNELGSFCKRMNMGNHVMLVSNSTVARLYCEDTKNSLKKCGYNVTSIEIPDGEEFKDLTTLKNIYDALIDAKLDREAFLVALGGGVVGDITGFAASTYLRGIPYIQVPTTLLAQVDSSVGGKTGINHEKGKNLIGSFYQPKMVLIDLSTLDSLPEREYKSGLAEVVKYGIVCDSGFFTFIIENVDKLLVRDKKCLEKVILRSCELKASVVSMDEKESGLRAVLNFGHTIGHAIESLTDYKKFLHGEAVAIGMVQAAKVSERMGYSKEEDTYRIVSLLKNLGLPVDPPSFAAEQYLDAICHDKKVRNGGLTFVLNKGIGAFLLEKIDDLGLILKFCGIGGKI